MTVGWHAITLETHDSVNSASPGNLSPPKGTCVYLSLRRVTIASVCDAKSLPSRERRRCSPSRIKFITSRARVALANRVCNTVKVHTRSISTKRANRPFRTHGLSGSTGLQDIAAETRKRVNASTLSLTSIRLVRHRINGMPQFPSTLPPPPDRARHPFVRVISSGKIRTTADRSSAEIGDLYDRNSYIS